MSPAERIEALLIEAAPLRDLGDDDPRKEALQPLVAEINRLRALQDAEAKRAMVEPVPDEPKRGPGRPRKEAA